MTVTWAQPAASTCKLQSASNPTGPFADVIPAPASPYTTSVAGGPKYFRTVWVAPTP